MSSVGAIEIWEAVAETIMSNGGEPLTAKDISQKLGLPLEAVEKIVSRDEFWDGVRERLAKRHRITFRRLSCDL